MSGRFAFQFSRNRRCLIGSSRPCVHPSIRGPSLRRGLRTANPQTHSTAYRTSRLAAFVAAGSATAYALISNRKLLDAVPRDQPAVIPGDAEHDVHGYADTTTSTVPLFPRTIYLPRTSDSGLLPTSQSAALPVGMGAASKEEEYQLLGVGVRKVSFLNIEVYVVGVYIAKSDLGRLQERLVKASIGTGATTLVQGEKDDLKKKLVHPETSDALWTKVLRTGGVKSAVRIVPVKKTNFSHLRDGWIRGIEARKNGSEFVDSLFDKAVADFKGIMGGQGSVQTGRVMLLDRDGQGALRIWVEEDAATPLPSPDKAPLLVNTDKLRLLGEVSDERVSRLVWLTYISGGKPASEQARKNVTDGVIDLVERPVGTVETQVI